jgi:hypothetical protein
MNDMPSPCTEPEFNSGGVNHHKISDLDKANYGC